MPTCLLPQIHTRPTAPNRNTHRNNAMKESKMTPWRAERYPCALSSHGFQVKTIALFIDYNVRGTSWTQCSFYPPCHRLNHPKATLGEYYHLILFVIKGSHRSGLIYWIVEKKKSSFPNPQKLSLKTSINCIVGISAEPWLKCCWFENLKQRFRRQTENYSSKTMNPQNKLGIYIYNLRTDPQCLKRIN